MPTKNQGQSAGAAATLAIIVSGREPETHFRSAQRTDMIPRVPVETVRAAEEAN